MHLLVSSCGVYYQNCRTCQKGTIDAQNGIYHIPSKFRAFLVLKLIPFDAPRLVH